MKSFFQKPFAAAPNPSVSDPMVRSAMTGFHGPARASMVNRTHRIVRERAKAIAARRSRIRSLYVPLAVCSSLLIILCTAVWNVLDQYDVTPDGIPDAGKQFLVLCLWFFPVSMALLAVALFRRARNKRNDGEMVS